jgi:hypothetical protein
MRLVKVRVDYTSSKNVLSHWPCGSAKTGVCFILPFVHGGVGWGGQQRSFRPQEKTEQGRKVKRFYAAVPDEIIIWPLASTPGPLRFYSDRLVFHDFSQ